MFRRLFQPNRRTVRTINGWIAAVAARLTLVPSVARQCGYEPQEMEDTATLGRVVEEVPGKVIEETWPKTCSDVYSQTILPTFELEITEDVWSAFRSDCTAGTHHYRPVVFHYGDETVSAARLKGNWHGVATNINSSFPSMKKTRMVDFMDCGRLCWTRPGMTIHFYTSDWPSRFLKNERCRIAAATMRGF